MTLALAVLVASLVGSPHCAGMCGPFVCFYAGAGAGARPVARWAAHAAYNGGRLLSYLALGALAGTLGAGLDAAGSMA
ncbi:MAG TPA: sulfite exporter TauE/SafE family protein, partial [Gemmatimonadales bacterium]